MRAARKGKPGGPGRVGGAEGARLHGCGGGDRSRGLRGAAGDAPAGVLVADRDVFAFESTHDACVVEEAELAADLLELALE